MPRQYSDSAGRSADVLTAQRYHVGALARRRTIVRIVWCLAMGAAGPAQPGAATSVQGAYPAYQQGDYAAARQLWQPLAQAGDIRAQYALGQLYLQGLGVDQNPAEAVAWFEKAAHQGHRDAMFNLASATWTGNGTPPDRSAAVQWWRRAATLNDAASQYNLGLALYNGIGVKRNLLQAAFWTREAANNHDANAAALYRYIVRQQPAIVQQIGAATPLAGAPQSDGQAPPATPESFPAPSATANPDTAPNLPPAPGDGRIGAARTPVFADRSVDAVVLERLPPGTPVRILSVSADWSKVQVPGGLVVWVSRDYITVKANVGQVIADKVNARPLPGTRRAPPIGLLARGDQLAVLAIQGRWVKARAPKLLPAWVLTRNIRNAPANANWQHDWAAAARRQPDSGRPH